LLGETFLTAAILWQTRYALIQGSIP
jgi:hypothetical protein